MSKIGPPAAMTPKYLKQLRSYVERRGLSATVTRGQGKSGLLSSIRSRIRQIDLSPLSTVKNEEGFQRWLNQQTVSLVSGLAQPYLLRWGTARKVLNIWLRDLTYNGDLCEAHKLKQLRPFLEIPLDSYSAKYLRAKSPSKPLFPIWKGVMHLTPEESAVYQRAATQVQGQEKWAATRVDLDVEAWIRGD